MLAITNFPAGKLDVRKPSIDQSSGAWGPIVVALERWFEAAGLRSYWARDHGRGIMLTILGCGTNDRDEFRWIDLANISVHGLAVHVVVPLVVKEGGPETEGITYCYNNRRNFKLDFADPKFANKLVHKLRRLDAITEGEQIRLLGAL